MSTAFRIITAPNEDNTGRVLSLVTKSVAYAATVTLRPNASNTLAQFAQLTGALTVNVAVGTSTTPPYVGDELELLFTSDATGRTVTLGTGFVATAATIVITASKGAHAKFMFNGVAWQEVSRAIYA